MKKKLLIIAACLLFLPGQSAVADEVTMIINTDKMMYFRPDVIWLDMKVQFSNFVFFPVHSEREIIVKDIHGNIIPERPDRWVGSPFNFGAWEYLFAVPDMYWGQRVNLLNIYNLKPGCYRIKYVMKKPKDSVVKLLEIISGCQSCFGKNFNDIWAKYVWSGVLESNEAQIMVL